SICFGVIGNFAPVPDRWRMPITVVAMIGLVVSGVAWLVEHFRASRKRREHTTAVEEKNSGLMQPSVHAPVMQINPTQDLGYLADPAYDRFWPDGWRDALITRGQHLVEQWTIRLDYPEKQRRENDSRNWLCEADEFAGKHLTEAQMNEFILHHSKAASGSKKFDFGTALIQAGTEPGAEDGNLAFEIFGKVKLLERFRSKSMPPADVQ